MPFRDLTGHRRLLSLLSRAVARDTLPPALLLAGARGIGKRRTAIALAQALNCSTPRASDKFERDACGECLSCRRIERGVHPDVIVLAPGESGSIKIEDVRDVVSRSGYRPFEGRRRVVIIDDADALVDAAQHALLKTLEEPPSASVFVLVSSMPDSLLATVRSRCPRLRFGGLTPAEVAAVLMASHGYSEPEARAAAADAEGSIGLALEGQSVDLAEVRQIAQRLLEQTARRPDPTRRIELAKTLAGDKGAAAKERDYMASCLRALSSLLRDLGLVESHADPRVLANADLEADLRRLAGAFDSDRSVRAFEAVDRALGALERNASPKLVADWLVLQL